MPAAVLSRVMAYSWLSSLVPLPVGYRLMGYLGQIAGSTEVLTAVAVVWIAVLGRRCWCPWCGG